MECDFFDWTSLNAYGKDYEWFLTGGCLRNDLRFAVIFFNLIGASVSVLVSAFCIVYELDRCGSIYFRKDSGVILTLAATCSVFALLYNANAMFAANLYYLERILWIFTSTTGFSCQTIVAYSWMNISGSIPERLRSNAGRIRARLRKSLIAGRGIAFVGTVVTCSLACYYQAKLDRDRSTIAFCAQLIVASLDCGFIGWQFFVRGGELVQGIQLSCTELREGHENKGLRDLRDVASKMDKFRRFAFTNALSMLGMMLICVVWAAVTFHTEKGAQYIGYFTLAFGPPVIVTMGATIVFFGVMPILRYTNFDDEYGSESNFSSQQPSESILGGETSSSFNLPSAHKSTLYQNDETTTTTTTTIETTATIPSTLHSRYEKELIPIKYPPKSLRNGENRP
ncbi:hypothetical protein HDU87_004195 [Geranomyces variabilis]|uniref:Uncharacterized protein n=1 Tax=Geranomyces variabilis TaxID=109894 RepID=A0AAD5TJ81_9FUNG|nr:hypothetical protein HDU87_004195 [Geranomyces variabilis]